MSFKYFFAVIIITTNACTTNLKTMRIQPILAIEHCEESLSPWLLLEYKHCAKLWKNNLVFTHVTKKKTAVALRPLGSVKKEKADIAFHGKPGIVLDPQATKPLTPRDCHAYDVIVIGGLLGYEQPKGRTKTMISDTSRFETRHLGNIQLSIDGAAFVAKAICLGMKLKDIEITREVEIKYDSVHSTILPFGYPIIDNCPVITPGLIDYLTNL
jgi:ribosome biogenesis SPOUT family RNA methylase Rps3